MSNIIEQTLENRTPVQAAPSRGLPLRAKLMKGYVDVLGVVSPKAAARRATDIFGYTRSFRQKPLKDMTPLGARRFEVKGVDGVAYANLWGKSSRTVLLVHGWGSDSSSMFSFVRGLLKAGFQVAAFDAPAHGASDGTVTTMTAFKNAVKGVITALGGVECIVAHSLGSIASTGALAELPTSAVARMVLLSPPCTLPAVIDRWSNGFLQLSPRVAKEMRAELWKRNGVPVDHWDIGVLGRSLRTEILVMHSPSDAIVPICESENIVAALPSVTLERIEKVGHIRILSDAAVLERVTGFLSKTSADTPHAAVVATTAASAAS